MRRFLMLVAVALAAVAVGAPAALAEAADPPHRAASADWSGVSASEWDNDGFDGCLGSECSFSDSGTMRTKSRAFGVLVDNSCTVTLSGTLDGNGVVDASSSSVGCGFVPSQGQICQHKITGEYWLRLVFGAPSAPRPSFAQIAADPSGQPTNVPTVFLRRALLGNPSTNAFADVYYTTSGGSLVNAYQSGEFDLWGPGQVIAGPSGAGCNWPELS
ncbi:MAG TPA: hypothetical protein VHF90_05110 [Thermoleophilaceae bacterium]|nr:hypothetical protein [Thermoleophilaceae bacterium]